MGNIFTKRAGEEGAQTGESKMIDSNKIDTIIGPNSNIKGDLHSKGTLRIDGTVEGNITSESTIILGEKGVANATLTAQQVIVGGTVHGNVIAEDRLEILSTGKMYGDVETAPSRFIVAEGVIFEGRCTMRSANKGGKAKASAATLRETGEKDLPKVETKAADLRKSVPAGT